MAHLHLRREIMSDSTSHHTDFSSKIDDPHIRLYVVSKIKRSHNFSFISILLSGGDIEINPGPVKNPCGVCLKPIAKNHRAHTCDSCQLMSHLTYNHIDHKNVFAIVMCKVVTLNMVAVYKH